MRIRVEGRTLFGTPVEIVKKFGEFALFDEKNSVDQYITQVLRGLGSKKKLSGKTLEARCDSFLKELENLGYLKIL